MAIEGNYVDESDIDSWGDEVSDEEKQAIIDRAEQKIERLTKDFFYAKTFAKYFSGNGKDRLFLGFTADIISVTEILVAGTELDTSWWTFDENSVYLDPEAVSGGIGDLAELHLRLKTEKVLFPRGMNNIKVTGTYGWSTCPAAIKLATVMLCKAEMDDSLYTRYGDFKSERLGDYSYTRGDDKRTVSSGILEVDNQLKEYTRRKPIMGVA